VPSSGSTQAAGHQRSAQSTIAGEPLFPLRYYGTHGSSGAGMVVLVGGDSGGRRTATVPLPDQGRVPDGRYLVGEMDIAVDRTGVERLKTTG
jgi:hypothetical protein